ncbi:hypothetical protein KDA00_01010 [Candidatus Saccharibacteria bacterium]|nr:hypothetical protein [Candidatus Saccharibacteria bacterium]
MTSRKRNLHHAQKSLRPLKTVYLVILLALVVATSVYSLRQNNLNAIRLRDAVIEVDKNNGDIESALQDLRRYTYAHMNTNLSAGTTSIQQPIQLKYTYERLLASEKERVSKVNEKVYADAQVTCEKLYPIGLSGSGRIPCIEDYVAKNGAKEQPIQDSLYKFSFTSPKWSFDLAGISLAIACVLLIIIVAKVSLDHWLKGQMRDHL